MNWALIVLVIAGLLLVTVVAVNAYVSNQPVVKTTSGCGSCNGQCTAESGCGKAGCSAAATGTCNCGK